MSIENWRGATQAEKLRISEQVLLEIDKYSAAPSRYAKLLDIYTRLDLPLDVQAGVKNALLADGFIILLALGAQVTETGASYAADLRAKAST